MVTVTDKLAGIHAKLAQQPQLSPAESAEQEKIWRRLQRASSDLRRAEKRGDEKQIAAAKRAVVRAEQFRNAFAEPRVGHLWAPTRIIYKTERHWSGPGIAGIHRQECEMVLDHKDLPGPEYRTVRVLSDEGGPPTLPRGAPNTMGVAWCSLADHIKIGKIVVLGDQVPS